MDGCCRNCGTYAISDIAAWSSGSGTVVNNKIFTVFGVSKRCGSECVFRYCGGGIFDMWSGMYTFWNRKLEKVEKKIKGTRHGAGY